MDVLALLASLLAVCVSVYALKFQRRLGHETSSQTLIHAQYELCRVLDVLRVENPEVSHVLALPAAGPTWDTYFLFRQHVRSLLVKEGQAPDESAEARLYLQEHATALHVADIYEQTIYQRELASRARDKGRFEILDTLVTYYEKRMLRNPRLRFHWDHGVSDMMEEETPADVRRGVPPGGRRAPGPGPVRPVQHRRGEVQVGSEAMTTYSVGRRLSRNEEHGELAPHVADMRRALGTRVKRPKAATLARKQKQAAAAAESETKQS